MPVTRPLLSCSPFLSFQSALRASGQSCAQCPSFLHNLHFVQLEKSCSLLAHTVHISCAASRAACAASPACSFSVSRCSCLCVLLRLSCRRTVEVGVEFQCTQLSHWVDVCFVLWRCRPHRIFMWETQTYRELIGSGGAHSYR